MARVIFAALSNSPASKIFVITPLYMRGLMSNLSCFTRRTMAIVSPRRRIGSRKVKLIGSVAALAQRLERSGEIVLGLLLSSDPAHSAFGVGEARRRKRVHAKAAREHVAAIVDHRESDAEALDHLLDVGLVLVLRDADEDDVAVLAVQPFGGGKRLLAGLAVLGEELHHDDLTGRLGCVHRIAG